MAREIFVITIIKRPLSWRSAISTLVNFWIFSGAEGVVGLTGLVRGIKEGFRF
jgi:hypothetical protein